MACAIDFHAHFLPGADHGSDSLETSVGQLELLYRVGIKKAVAAPHFYPQRISVNGFLTLRERCAALLRPDLRECMPEVYLGAEVLFCRGIENMPGLEQLCIEGTHTLLLEMPMTAWYDYHYDSVYKLCKMGFNTVIAHVDRYPVKNVKTLLSETGAAAQLNASAVKSRKTKKSAAELLTGGRIYALGTDLHGVNKQEAESFCDFCRWAEDTMTEVFSKSELLLKGAKPL